MSNLDIDARVFAAYFDVHTWPALGRILMINKPTYSAEPVITELLVNADDHRTATFVVGLALAQAGDPTGAYFEHGSDGSIVELHLTGAQKGIIKKA